MELRKVMKRLQSLGRPGNIAGMARFGITPKKAFGISAPDLHALAKEIGTDQRLSLKLWETEYLEARALASLIGNPNEVTEAQMDRWVKDFDCWAVCDACCSHLFDKTPMAYRKAVEWARSDGEYVKRAGYVMMATLAVHDKRAGDEKFLRFLPLIVQGANDDRNYVKKAVNWALRQIGKRNRKLNRLAIVTAKRIRRLDSRPPRWIASDALRELRSSRVRRRVLSKKDVPSRK
ncbi:MAG: DNA alkylation repair protein [Ignavibacteria bacterium]|nr:DNA alkylation repair protein [Ignavibacteria bacterium]